MRIRHKLMLKTKSRFFDNPYMDDDDEQMEVGIDCCPHMVPYGGECYECDEYDEEYASSCLVI